MNHPARILATAALLVALPVAAQAALAPYTQGFETLNATSPTALGADGWLVFGNVYSADRSTYFYGYGPFPAPNAGNNFCAVATAQGGTEQGNQQLSIYSDYNNLDHGIGRLIESNTYREQTIAAGDVGTRWTFQFDAKLGNLFAPSTALAFIKTLDPANGFATTNFIKVNTTAIPTTWNTYTISISIGGGLVGQLLQFGFANDASNYVASGVFYDNVDWKLISTTDVGGPGSAAADLRPAAPNPFRASTKLDYSLPRAGEVTIFVLDVTGRRVKTLFRGAAPAGSGSVSWDGRYEDGRPAPAGVYHAALNTPLGRTTRTLVLAR